MFDAKLKLRERKAATSIRNPSVKFVCIRINTASHIHSFTHNIVLCHSLIAYTVVCICINQIHTHIYIYASVCGEQYMDSSAMNVYCITFILALAVSMVSHAY